MQQSIIGLILICVGVLYFFYAFSKKKQGIDSYIFIRNISGSILLIFIGIMVLLGKW